MKGGKKRGIEKRSGKKVVPLEVPTHHVHASKGSRGSRKGEGGDRRRQEIINLALPL